MQIVICALAGGLVFAVIENFLYLHVAIKNPPEWLIYWRWTVCVALHTGCSLIAGLGLMRIWADTTVNRVRPRLSLGSPLLLTAVIIHGCYNGFAVILSLAEQTF